MAAMTRPAGRGDDDDDDERPIGDPDDDEDYDEDEDDDDDEEPLRVGASLAARHIAMQHRRRFSGIIKILRRTLHSVCT